MVDKKDDDFEKGSSTVPASPNSKRHSEVGRIVAQRTREEVEKMIEEESQLWPEFFRSFIMAQADQLVWRDEAGQEVGFVSSEGENIRRFVENSLLRMSTLLIQKEEVLEPDVDEKLRSVSSKIDPASFSEAKAVLTEIERNLEALKQRVRDLGDYPDYLLAFRKGEDLRTDLNRSLRTMEKAGSFDYLYLQQAAEEERITVDEVVRRVTELSNAEVEGFLQGTGVEFRARFELHEERRAEILDLAAHEGDKELIAKKMLGLTAGQLNILHNALAAQLLQLYSAEDFELGDTDAESFFTALDSLNKSLVALIDIKRTRQVIPGLR